MRPGPEMDASSKNVCKSRFGDPVPMFERASAVAREVMADATWLGDALGTRCKYAAATPVTCGAAIDVPLRVLVAGLLFHHAEMMSCPGANRSRHDPNFENKEQASDEVEAPSVRA